MVVGNLKLGQDQCTLIYDGDCRFCVKSKEEMQRFSGPNSSASIRYIPYQSLEAEQLLGSEYQPGRPEVAYFIGTDGLIRKGLDAILPLLAMLPGGWVVRTILKIPGCRAIAAWLYRVVARHRYHWFGVMSTNGSQ